MAARAQASPSSQLSIALSGLFSVLLGKPPTIDNIRSLSYEALKEWLNRLGLAATGNKVVLQSRLSDHFSLSESEPTELSAPSSKRQRTRESGTDESQEEGEEEVEASVHPVMARPVAPPEESQSFLNILVKLDKRLKNLESLAASSKSSAADLDWWVNIVVDFNLGSFVQLKSSSEAPIEPLLGVLKF